MAALNVFRSLPPACMHRCRGLFAYYALTAAMLALPMASMTLLLNTQLGLAARPERVTAYYQAMFATTALRPLLGLASDGARSRRRSLLALASLCAGAATWVLGALVDSLPSLFATGVCAALAFCAAETVADGALIEASAGDAALVAQLQVAAMFVRSAAAAAASLLGAALLRVATPRVVICLAGCFGMAAAAVVFARFEAAGAQQRRLAAELSSPRRIVAVLRRRALPAVLLFSLAASPSATDAYTSYMSVTLTPQLLGIATAAETLCALGGTLWYGAAAGRHSTCVLLAAGVTAAACVSILRAAAPSMQSPAYILLVSALSGAASRLAFMPVLVLSAQLAPPGAEAACFAALVTVNDLGALLGSSLSQGLTAALRVGQPPDRSWKLLPVLVLVCALASVAPLLMLPCVQQLGPGEAPAHHDLPFTEDAAVPLLESGELEEPVAGAEDSEE